MKPKFHRILWSLCLLCSAASLLLYAFDVDSTFFELPLYKLIIVIVLVSYIISRAAFKSTLRQRLRIFLPLSAVIVLLEETIAGWIGAADKNLFHGFAIIAAGLIIDIAIGIMVPKRFTKRNHNTNRFSSSTHYIDAGTTKVSWISNKMGETTVFYQNTDSLSPDTVLELNIDNHMGNVNVHIPENWIIDDHIIAKFGETSIRTSKGFGIKLVLKGDNRFGNINIVSP